MNKKEWKEFWHLYRSVGAGGLKYYSKDAALICINCMVARNTGDPLVEKAKTRKWALRWIRAGWPY